MRVKVLLAVCIVGGIVAFSVYWYTTSSSTISFLSPLTEQVINPRPLEKYTFENLRTADIPTSEIKTERVLAEEDKFVSHVFSYLVDGKKVTGQMNIPYGTVPPEGFPTIVMIRGFIDPANYKTGDGTRRAAEVFANHGFTTFAPDMLGYGESDDSDPNTIAARVIRPYELLVLLKTLEGRKLGLWAHSNGGQIALSLLEITGKAIPTILWAPVSKPFPYSILYYTDEYEDNGKAIRKVIADFEQSYDADKYSIHAYYDWIQASIQIHQGTADDAIPTEWTDQLVEILKDKDKEVTYFRYPGTDHDLRPSWDTAIQRDLAFFTKNL